jgi:hypothetical protein
MTRRKQIVALDTPKGRPIMSTHTRPREAMYAIFLFSLMTGILISLIGFALEINRLYSGLKYSVWSKTHIGVLLPTETLRTLVYGDRWLGIKQIILWIIQTDISTFLVLFGMFWIGLMILLNYLLEL